MPAPLSGDDVCILLVTETRDLTDLVSEALQAWTVPYRLFWVSQLELAAVRARDISPRIILLDAQAGASQALALVAQLSERVPEAGILLLVDQDRMDIAGRAMFAGAAGFVSLPLESAELTTGLRKVLSRPGARRSVANIAAARGRVIALCAPKGGTGRTTLAINSAISIWQRSQEAVVLVDGDFAAPALDVALNLHSQPTIVDLLPRLGQLDRDLLDGVLAVHSSGIRLLLAPPPANLDAPVSVLHMQQILVALKRFYAWILVDVGLPLGEMAYGILDGADAIVVSVVPEMVGVRNAQDMLRQFHRRGIAWDRVWVIVNQATLPGGLKVDDVEARLGVRIRHQLPRDQALATTTVNHGVPFVLMRPHSAFAKGCRELAQKLITSIGEPAAADQPYSKSAPGAAEPANELPVFAPRIPLEALPAAGLPAPAQDLAETPAPFEAPMASERADRAAQAGPQPIEEFSLPEAEPPDNVVTASLAQPVVDAAVEAAQDPVMAPVFGAPAIAEPVAERAAGLPSFMASSATVPAESLSPATGEPLAEPEDERAVEGLPDLPSASAPPAAVIFASADAAAGSAEAGLLAAATPQSLAEPPVNTALPITAESTSGVGSELTPVSTPATVDGARDAPSLGASARVELDLPVAMPDARERRPGTPAGGQSVREQDPAMGAARPAAPVAPRRPYNPYARAGWTLAQVLIKLAARPAAPRPADTTGRLRPAPAATVLPEAKSDAPIPPAPATFGGLEHDLAARQLAGPAAFQPAEPPVATLAAGEVAPGAELTGGETPPIRAASSVAPALEPAAAERVDEAAEFTAEMSWHAAPSFAQLAPAEDEPIDAAAVDAAEGETPSTELLAMSAPEQAGEPLTEAIAALTTEAPEIAEPVWEAAPDTAPLTLEAASFEGEQIEAPVSAASEGEPVVQSRAEPAADEQIEAPVGAAAEGETPSTELLAMSAPEQAGEPFTEAVAALTTEAPEIAGPVWEAAPDTAPLTLEAASPAGELIEAPVGEASPGEAPLIAPAALLAPEATGEPPPQSPINSEPKGNQAANAPLAKTDRARSAVTELWAAAGALAAALRALAVALIWRIVGAGEAVMAVVQKSVAPSPTEAGTPNSTGSLPYPRSRLSVSIIAVSLAVVAVALLATHLLLERRVPPAQPLVEATGGISTTSHPQQPSPRPQSALAYVPTVSRTAVPSTRPTLTPLTVGSPAASPGGQPVSAQVPSATPTYTSVPVPTRVPATATRPPSSAPPAGGAKRPTVTTKLRQATARPAAAQAPAAPTSVRWVSSPALVAPAEDSQVRGVVTFAWLATGPLPTGTAYEVVWWNVGENPSAARGIAPPTRETSLATNLDVLYQAHLFTNNQFYWAVLIVQTAPYARLIQADAAGVHTLLYSP